MQAWCKCCPFCRVGFSTIKSNHVHVVLKLLSPLQHKGCTHSSPMPCEPLLFICMHAALHICHVQCPLPTCLLVQQVQPR